MQIIRMKTLDGMPSKHRAIASCHCTAVNRIWLLELTDGLCPSIFTSLWSLLSVTVSRPPLQLLQAGWMPDDARQLWRCQLPRCPQTGISETPDGPRWGLYHPGSRRSDWQFQCLLSNYFRNQSCITKLFHICWFLSKRWALSTYTWLQLATFVKSWQSYINIFFFYLS